MDSNLDNHNQQIMNNNTSSSSGGGGGLTRYRSAPSSYFSNLINSGIYSEDDVNIDQFFNPPRVSGNGDSTAQRILKQIEGFQPQFMDSVKQEQEPVYTEPQQQPQPMIYSNQFHNSNNNNQSVSNCSSTVVESVNVNLPNNLLRQSSSPAGFFAQLEIDNGYNMMRSIDDYRGRGNVSNSLLTTTKRMKNEMGFSSGSLASSGVLPRINEGKVMDMKSGGNDGGFGSHSWDDSEILADSFLKDFGESDQNKMSNLNSSENQHNDVGRIRAPTTLIHHMSLPASTAELDKLMQFQDSVPLRSRAKRGCATHPRSIAERVRRTRISERMRKLEELVPNMDKQTNTADMLDLAVDYIKELQKEAETLSDQHEKCKCPHKQKV